MPWRNVALLLNESHLVNFLYGRNAGANLRESAFAERSHTFFAGDTLNFGCWAAIDDHFADAIGEVEKLADRGSAVIAGAAALEAAGAFGERNSAPYTGIET